MVRTYRLLLLLSLAAFASSLPVEKPEQLNGGSNKTLNTIIKAISAQNPAQYAKRLTIVQKPAYMHNAIQFERSENAAIPNAIDWRSRGVISTVKDQGESSSSWAFSAIGAVEAHLAIKTGDLVDLSEQNLFDCSNVNANDLLTGAYDYIKRNGGVNEESSYPYIGKKQSCHVQNARAKPELRGYYNVPEGDENMLMKAVASRGPVSVLIDASHPSFQTYRGGIYYEPAYNAGNLNLAVLLVGYGTDTEEGDYWILKASFGSTWGEQGFMRLARNKGNHCGVASMAVFPQL